MILFFQKLHNRFKLLRTDLPVLYLATKDKRTPVTTKLMFGLTIVYLFSPIDIVPDFIPVLGLVDDLFMVPFLASMAIKTVPAAVLNDVRLRLAKKKSNIKNWLLIFFVIIICAVAAYYLYQHYYSDNAEGWI